jgi:hypothetical protein
VPILPRKEIEIIQTPFPVILGITRACFDEEVDLSEVSDSMIFIKSEAG